MLPILSPQYYVQANDKKVLKAFLASIKAFTKILFRVYFNSKINIITQMLSAIRIT